MDKIIVQKILGVHLDVVTDKGELYTMSLTNLINNRDSKMAISYNDGCPTYEIDIHLECDGYGLGVDYSRD